MQPCAVCGEPTTGPRCPEHRPKDTRTRRGPGQAAHDPVWRALSSQVRRAQPWCTDCGRTDDLTADHVIPKSVAPELVHAIENVEVRCRPCNASRGATGYTHAEARAVLSRLQATYRRRPCRKVAERVKVAQRAAQGEHGWGETPDEDPATPRGRQSLSYSPAHGLR